VAAGHPVAHHLAHLLDQGLLIPLGRLPSLTPTAGRVISPRPLVVSYTNGSPIAGLGNFTANPLFVSPADRDYHRRFGSSSIDAGQTGFGDDFEGDLEQGGLADVGADEFAPRAYVGGDFAPGGTVALRVVGVPGRRSCCFSPPVASSPRSPRPTVPWDSFSRYYLLADRPPDDTGQLLHRPAGAPSPHGPDCDHDPLPGIHRGHVPAAHPDRDATRRLTTISRL